MEATELRIGNIIQYSKSHYWSPKFHGIDEKVDWDILKDIEFNPEGDTLYEPILLTKEWMVRFGFEIDGDQRTDDIEFHHPKNTDFDLMFSCSVNKLWCAYNFGKEVTNIRTEIVSQPICNPFKYVHQLQNLYYALTGHELVLAVTPNEV